MRHIEFLKQIVIESNLKQKVKGERFKRFRYKNRPKQEVSYISVQKNIFSKLKKYQ